METAAVREQDAKEEFYTSIVNGHLDEIYNYARYMVLDYDEADDIVQKTFLSLYQNLHKLDTSVSLRPWLFRVARNHCLDHIKKKKSLQFSQVEDQILEIPENDTAIEEKVDSELFQENFKRLVETLPVNMKEVLLLRYFQDLTLEQIAGVLEQPLGSVKSNFYRGKARLYQMIKQA